MPGEEQIKLFSKAKLPLKSCLIPANIFLTLNQAPLSGYYTDFPATSNNFYCHKACNLAFYCLVVKDQEFFLTNFTF